MAPSRPYGPLPSIRDGPPNPRLLSSSFTAGLLLSYYLPTPFGPLPTARCRGHCSSPCVSSLRLRAAGTRTTMANTDRHQPPPLRVREKHPLREGGISSLLPSQRLLPARNGPIPSRRRHQKIRHLLPAKASRSLTLTLATLPVCSGTHSGKLSTITTPMGQRSAKKYSRGGAVKTGRCFLCSGERK